MTSALSRTWLPPFAIAAAGAIVYANSLGGVFLYDDIHSIVENARLAELSSIAGDRPLVRLSLWINHALGGLDPRGYHVFNVLIHVMAGLALYGLVRRAMMLPANAATSHSGPEGRTRVARSTGVAFATALLWTLHPLQTQSVTYVIQRAEAMMGLFVLLMLYALLRAATSAERRAQCLWSIAAVASCALGMASKGVCIVAPAVALLFDWTLLSRGNFAQVLRKRWAVHLGLLSTILVLVATGLVEMVFMPEAGRSPTVGFGYAGSTPLEYAMTQPGAIVHYLSLALWPASLCLDYAWPIARSAGASVPPAAIVAILAGASLWALRARPWIGFVGVSFFLVLAPTSSIIPLRDAAFDHRMYLPLAAPLLVAVAAVAHVGVRRCRPGLLAGALAAIAVTFGTLTVIRNLDYRDANRMWQDVLAKRPDNPVAHNELGMLAASAGNLDHATWRFERAVRLDPGNPTYRANLGSALVLADALDEGIAHLEEAVAIRERNAKARMVLGRALALKARRDGDSIARTNAVDHLVAVLQQRPGDEEATRYLAGTLAETDDIDAAAAPHRTTAPIARSEALAWMIVGDRLDRAGRVEEAAPCYRRAAAIDPECSVVQSRLARLDATAQGEPDAANDR